MTLVATMFIYGKDRVRALMWVIAMSLGYYGIKGGIWSILNGGAEQVLGPEGSFIEGNTFLSLALNMVIPVMVSLAQEEPRPWVRRFLYAGAGLSVIASFFTYSRGGWLGLAVVLGMFMLRLRWSARIGLGMAVLVIALGAQSLLPERVFSRADSLENYEEDCSANQRFMSWTVNWNIAKEYPVTGAGFQFDESGDPRWLRYGDQKYLGCFGDYVSSSAHSIYFQILGQHGFVALFLFLLLLFLSMRKLSGLRRATRADPENRWIGTYATGLQIGLLAYAVSGAFLSSAYFDLAWLYYALTDIFARELADARAKQGAVVTQPSGAPRVGVIRAGQTT
jgi:putative inorganic carbon (HCO3(-)) transporter